MACSGQNLFLVFSLSNSSRLPINRNIACNRHIVDRNCANDEEYETVLPRTEVDDPLFGDKRGPALDGELSPVNLGRLTKLL